MKHFIFLTVIALLGIGMYSCSNKEDIQQASSSATGVINSEIKGVPGLVRQIITDNSFIDVDVVELSNDIANMPGSSRNIDDLKEDISMAKAAIYRFYSNVTVSDEGFILGECTAKSLNMSDVVFNALKNNLDEMNAFYIKERDNGHSVEISPITQEYLESLLE